MIDMIDMVTCGTVIHALGLGGALRDFFLAQI